MNAFSARRQLLGRRVASGAVIGLVGLFAAGFAGKTGRAAPPTPPAIGASAAPFALRALGGGAQVRLSDLIRRGPVVLVLLRGYPGYQCPVCTAQVGSLLSAAPQFAAAKAQVVLVYPGPSAGLERHADEFVRGKTLPSNFHLALDGDFAFTNRYGLRWDAPGETAYPSTFVINNKGRVTFAKISRSHGDRAQTDDILKALGARRARRAN